MAVETSNALLYGPGIRALLQHYRVMVCLKDKQATIFKVFFYPVRCLTKICGYADFDAVPGDGKAGRILCVMGKRKRMNR